MRVFIFCSAVIATVIGGSLSFANRDRSFETTAVTDDSEVTNASETNSENESYGGRNDGGYDMTTVPGATRGTTNARIPNTERNSVTGESNWTDIDMINSQQ